MAVAETHTGAADYIRAVTDFLFVRDEAAPSDAVFVPGSSHVGPPLRAAGLWHAGMAGRVVLSGRCPIGTETFRIPGYASEAAWMRGLLLEAGVPEEAILLEEQASYTWENAQFSRDLCLEAGLTVRQAILCCRPFHARRALLYYEAAFPDTAWRVVPAEEPGLDRDDWFTTAEGRKRILGELRRLGSQVNEVFEMMMNGG